jgi:hypothetical protein
MLSWSQLRELRDLGVELGGTVIAPHSMGRRHSEQLEKHYGLSNC